MIAGTFHRWLAQLPDIARDRIARDYAARAAAEGAFVTTTEREIPIPPLLTPSVTALEESVRLERDAHALLQAITRLTRWLMEPGNGEHHRARLFEAFTPFERTALTANWREAERLATARVDLLADSAGPYRALEVNATIPAMQGYSDVIAESFLRVVCGTLDFAPTEIDRLVDRNGRNTDDLLASLESRYRLLGGSDDRPPTVAIVARPGDAQLGELRHYVTRFGQRGSSARIFAPDEITFDSDGNLLARGDRFDLFYRHIFARRLDGDSAFARACLDPRRHRILNPIASHLEVKAMLGYLSAAVTPTGRPSAEEIGLDDDHRAAIERLLPWTRILASGITTRADGSSVPDLLAFVVGEAERFVLKRSWDYGGRSVFLGAEYDDAAAVRAQRLFGSDRPPSWAELVRMASTDPQGIWVVQEIVRSLSSPHLIASADGGRWANLYVDRSIYTTLGVPARASGGAVRAAPGRIVNILGGGGLAPLIRLEVLEEIVKRLPAAVR